MLCPWGMPRHWRIEGGEGASSPDIKGTAEKGKGVSKAVTRLQALFRGRLARKTHVPIVKSGTAWGPPVWMKPKAINDMLSLAKAGPDDILYDMGSGHGAVVVAAIRDFKVKRAVGIEIDPLRIRIAVRLLNEAGLGFSQKSPRASFLCTGVLDEKARAVAEASIVTCFMSPNAHKVVRSPSSSSRRRRRRPSSHHRHRHRHPHHQAMHNIDTTKQHAASACFRQAPLSPGHQGGVLRLPPRQ